VDRASLAKAAADRGIVVEVPVEEPARIQPMPMEPRWTRCSTSGFLIHDPQHSTFLSDAEIEAMRQLSTSAGGDTH
jgi:hypothetical protein